jgi:hypothetical protein
MGKAMEGPVEGNIQGMENQTTETEINSSEINY